MPELPEVETIARTLTPQVEGRRIVACELLNPSTFAGTIPLGKVVGGVIGRPGRRGKLLLLPLAFGSDPLPSCGRGLSVRFAGPVPCLRG